MESGLSLNLPLTTSGMGGGRYGVDVHHGDEAKNQERQKNLKPPFLTCQMLKWFYDTSTGTATGAACCGSLFGNGFGLLVVS
jgi:hypothetical protein